jgi:hypothetical protein
MSISSQTFSRRQQLLWLGTARADHQRAQVLSTHRIPSSTLRLLRPGRPLFLPGGIVGSRGWSFNHWSSINSGAGRAIVSPPTAYYPKALLMSIGLSTRIHYILCSFRSGLPKREVMKPLLTISNQKVFESVFSRKIHMKILLRLLKQ